MFGVSKVKFNIFSFRIVFLSIITITMIIAFHLHQHATGANALPTPPTLPTRAHNPDRHATQVTHGSTKSMPFFKLEQK